MNDKLPNLIWIDLEMTGLDPLNDQIIEIATLITDSQLNVLAEGPNLAIHLSDDILTKMNEWYTKQLNQEGLGVCVKQSTNTLAQA